jgi:thioredoxin 1
VPNGADPVEPGFMDVVKPLDRASVGALAARRTSTLGSVAVLVALVALSACGAGDVEPAGSASSSATNASMEPVGPDSGSSTDPSAEESAEAAAPADSVQPGAYVDLADYESDPTAYQSGAVVLFFAASWCPTCQAADESLTRAGVPDGLTVVKVDYDEETDLKRRYGVTVQHTFVQVDTDGNQLAKFAGSVTGEDILGETV